MNGLTKIEGENVHCERFIKLLLMMNNDRENVFLKFLLVCLSRLASTQGTEVKKKK